MPAELLVSRISVRSFRCLKTVDIALEAGTTVLVGENNAGKSSILLALATALGRRRSSTDDLFRSANGSVADTATIDVFISPIAEKQSFSDDVAQRLIGGQREPDSNRDIVGIRTVLKKSNEGSFLNERRTFLQPVNGEWIESPAPQFQSRVLELIDAHVLDASRDLLTEMGAQTSAWGRVLSDLKIPNLPDLEADILDPAGLRAIERDLVLIAERVRKASPVLSQLHADLGGMANTQATVESVELVPLPQRIEELGRAMEIILHQKNAAGLPLRFHGSGSRSLAALLVFKTMCVLKIGVDHGIRPHLLTLLEEPEAHLHPQAITALVKTIESLPGQRVVTTHSATLVAEMPPTAVRLLRRTSSGIAINCLTDAEPKTMEHFRRFFGRPFGEVIFARLAVLGDGVTERNVLPILVRMALNADPAALGIAFVDCQSMANYENVNKVLGALHSLGISWLYFADNDKEGLKALAAAKDPLTGAALHLDHPSVATLKDTKQTEKLLVDAGYGDEITQVALEHGVTAADDGKRVHFLASNKAWAPEQVALRAEEAGKPAPPQLNDLVAKIRVSLGLSVPTTTAH